MAENRVLFNPKRRQRTWLVSGTASTLKMRLKIGQPVDIEKGKENGVKIECSNALLIVGHLSGTS